VDIAKGATAGDATESSQSVNVNVPDNKALLDLGGQRKRMGVGLTLNLFKVMRR